MEQIEAPRIIAIFTAPSAGQPMTAHENVRVIPAVGIPGDRYATGDGHWSDPRWPDQELTLVEAELLSELQLPLDGLRRNLVTRDIDLERLIGQEFALGSARLRGVRNCTPCHYIEGLSRPGLLGQLRGRGGLRAAVIEEGEIAVADPIRILGSVAPSP